MPLTLTNMYETVNGFVAMDNVRDVIDSNLGRDSSLSKKLGPRIDMKLSLFDLHMQ